MSPNFCFTRANTGHPYRQFALSTFHLLSLLGLRLKGFYEFSQPVVVNNYSQAVLVLLLLLVVLLLLQVLELLLSIPVGEVRVHAHDGARGPAAAQAVQLRLDDNDDNNDDNV